MDSESEIYSISWRTFRHPMVRWLLRLTHHMAEWLLGLHRLRTLYYQVLEMDSGETFPERILQTLRITIDCSEADTARIPVHGPLVIVANHPFGAVEGLALLAMVQRRRKDVKILANYLLHRIPELRQDLLFIDPFGKPEASSRNAQALRSALHWLRNGHALIVFPAGEVASFEPRAFRIRDAVWHPTVVGLIRHARPETQIVPVYIPGTASLLFHLAGKIHPRLRTLLLPHELLRLRHRELTLRVGRALVAMNLFHRFKRDSEALRYLRFRTFLLAGRFRTSRLDEQMRRLTLEPETREEVPLIAPIPSAVMARELAALPQEALLLHTENYALYAVQGREIPQTLREIGRLREMTFRAVGEGTGNVLDTDDFDKAYYQILLWHTVKQEVIGCYRLAFSDVVAENDGLRALYTRTLFRFDERFLGRLPGPAVELGRSFVRPEFQRSFAPLLLLWRGVLTFLARHPHYTVLFGPVSISHDFCPAARDVLIRYLETTAFDHTLAHWVSPRLPPRKTRFSEWQHKDYDDFLKTEKDVALALSELEAGGHREMPVLIRQYLKLGGKIVAFNVDPDFGTVVDGLIVVDLLKAPPRDIARYMGKDQYEVYRRTQRKDF